jgi:hypothetical protein
LLLEKESELLQLQNGIYGSFEQQLEITEKIRENNIKLARAQLEMAEETYQVELASGKLDDKAKKSLAENLLAQKQTLTTLVKQQSALVNLDKNTSNMLGTFTGIGDQWKTTFLGSFSEVVKHSDGMGDAFRQIGTSVAKTTTLSNFLGSAMMKVQEATIALAVAQNQVLASFNKTNGAMGEYNDLITGIEQNNRVAGLSVEEVAQAVGDLRKNMAGWTTLTDAQQKSLSTLGAKMNAVGIDSGTFSENMNIAMGSLGMGLEPAKDMQLELLAVASAMEKPPQQVAAEFAAAAPQLAAHGAKMLDVFKGLQGGSRALGIEMSSLLNITKQFDTFEGAAKAAGTLNHVLGGDLVNSVELMAASEEERIRILIRAREESGRSLDQMTKQQQLALAQAAGIDNVAESNKLFGQSLSVYDDSVRKSQAATSAQAKLDERFEHTQDIAKKLLNVAKTFAIQITPLIEGISWVATKFLKLNKEVREGTKGFVNLSAMILVGAVALKGLLMVLSTATTVKALLATETGALAAAHTAEAGAAEAAAIAETQAAAAQQRSLASMKAAIPVMLSFGAAILMIGVGVGAAAFGVSYLVESFAGLNGEQINGVIGALAVLGLSIIGLALIMVTAGTPAALGILAMGAAMLMLGVGVGLASAGISLMATALGGLDPVQVASVSLSLGSFAAAMLSLVPLALVGPILAATFLAMGAGAMAIGLGFAMANSAISNFNSAITELAPTAAAQYSAIADEVERIVSSINKMSLVKGLLFKSIVQKIAVETPSVPVGGGAAAVAAAGVERASAGRTGSQTTASKTGGGSDGQMVPVIIELNGKELGKIIGKYADQRIKKALNEAGSMRKSSALSIA